MFVHIVNGNVFDTSDFIFDFCELLNPAAYAFDVLVNTITRAKNNTVTIDNNFFFIYLYLAFHENFSNKVII